MPKQPPSVFKYPLEFYYQYLSYKILNTYSQMSYLQKLIKQKLLKLPHTLNSHIPSK